MTTPAQPPIQGRPSLPDDAFSTVVDEAGQAIAGARVHVVVMGAAASPYAHHTLQVLARAPLLGIATDAEGRFTLPLTSAHRRLGTGHEPVMALVVEAEGYQAWHEPLPFGLTGFHGTRATLHRLVDADLHEIHIEDPPMGALLWISRIDCDPAAAAARIVPVPADGIVRVYAPLWPTPCVLDDWRQTRGLGHDVQLWAPGRSTARLRLDARTRKLRIARSVVWTRQLRVLTDGAPAVGVRGLYACPDGERRWLPSPDDCVREDGCLRLIAVTAQGCSAAVPDSGSLAPVELSSAGAGIAQVTIAIAGEAAPPKRLAALSVPLTCWPSAGSGRFLPQASKPVQVDGDTISLPVTTWQQEALVVVATGCSPRVLPPLTRGDVPTRIELWPATLLELSILAVDDDANPVPGAEVRMPLGVLAKSPRTALVPTTDGLGVCALPPLPPDHFQVLCVDDDGYGMHHLELPARRLPPADPALPGEPRARRTWPQHDAAVPLEGRTLRATLRSPFAAVTIESVTKAGERRTRKGFADAFGHVHAGYVGDEAKITCRGVQSEQRAVAGVAAQVLELGVPSQRLVGVELPAGARIKRVSYWLRDGGVRHESLDLDADRLALGWREDCIRGDVMLAEGPPATIVSQNLDTEVAALPMVNRERVLRTVPLHVFCGGQPVTDFAARPVRANSRLLIYDQRDGSPLQGGAFVARDRAAHELIVFHREFLPSLPVPVPAAQGERDKALIVDLVRGTKVRFRIPGSSAPPVGRDVSITIHDGGRPRYHVTLVSPGPDLNNTVDLLLPFALPREHYAAELTTGRETRRVTFVVDGQSEVVVE